MLNGKRFINSSPDQGELLPTYPSDLVPEDHPARVLNEIVDRLDLSVLYQKYSREGGKTYHPKTLIKILFYAYSTGNRQSRKINKACRENLVYMLLSGGLFPDFRTISDFRNNNFDILEDIFKQIVKLCHKLGMISFGNISLDGTKIKANASDKRIAQKDKLEEVKKKIDKEIEQMLKDAEALDAEDDKRFGAENSGDELPEKIKKSKERKKKFNRSWMK
jgi:transposase